MPVERQVTFCKQNKWILAIYRFPKKHDPNPFGLKIKRVSISRVPIILWPIFFNFFFVVIYLLCCMRSFRNDQTKRSLKLMNFFRDYPDVMWCLKLHQTFILVNLLSVNGAFHLTMSKRPTSNSCVSRLSSSCSTNIIFLFLILTYHNYLTLILVFFLFYFIHFLFYH